LYLNTIDTEAFNLGYKHFEKKEEEHFDIYEYLSIWVKAV